MWSRRSIEITASVSLLALLAACATAPKRPAASALGHPPVAAGKPGAAGNTTQAGKGQVAQAAAAPAPVPAEAQAQFGKALALAHAGSDDAAEAQLTSLAQQYPQLSTPLVDLGILYRKNGKLDAATHALRQAVARDPHSALGWTELGVTQRLAGQFQDAEKSYGLAIAANPTYAPAYRDRGVLRDLYLDEPAAALDDYERYRKLAGEDKPIVMWIAELRHRAGLSAPAAGPPTSVNNGPAQTQPNAAAHAAAASAPPQARN
jgi:tetratricopeptide (TPR) repeat protein